MSHSLYRTVFRRVSRRRWLAIRMCLDVESFRVSATSRNAAVAIMRIRADDPAFSFAFPRTAKKSLDKAT